MKAIMLFTPASLLVAGFLCCTEEIARGKDLNASQDLAVRQFVATQGANAELIQEFRNEAVETLLRELDSQNSLIRRGQIRRALLRYTMGHSDELDRDLVASVRSSVHAGLSAPEPQERAMTVDTIGMLEGKAALPILAPLLRDASERVWSTVIGEYNSLGNASEIAALEALIEERTRNESADELPKDRFVSQAREAIEQMKMRLNAGITPKPVMTLVDRTDPLSSSGIRRAPAFPVGTATKNESGRDFVEVRPMGRHPSVWGYVGIALVTILLAVGGLKMNRPRQ